MKNIIKVKLTEFGGIQVVSIPLKLYKDSYKVVNIECLLPKTTNKKSILKMYASGRDNLGNKVWTSQTYNLVYEKTILDNQQEYDVYTAPLPAEFSKEVGNIEITFKHMVLTQEDTVESVLTSGTVNLYIDGVGSNNAGVVISSYDITASKVNQLVKNIEEVQQNFATKEELEAVESSKIDKLPVEEDKLLVSNGKGGIRASNVGITEFEDQTEHINKLHNEQEQKIEQLHAEQNARMNRMQEEISANTKDRHTHHNRPLLDSYTVANSELQANTQARHKHANMSVLESITAAFTTELKNKLDDTVKSVEFNETTGKFTFTKNNGDTFEVDTLLEKIIVNFSYDKDKQALILVSKDGVPQEIPIGALLSPYTGSDGKEIAVTVNRENEIAASIKAGAVSTNKLADNAVTEQKLSTEFLESIQTQFAQMQAKIADLQENIFIKSKKEWLDLAYPIGTYYSTSRPPTSTDSDIKSFNPNTEWGGKWYLLPANAVLWSYNGSAVPMSNVAVSGETVSVPTRNSPGLPNILGELGKVLMQKNTNTGALNANWQESKGYPSGSAGQGQNILFNARNYNTVYGDVDSNTVRPNNYGAYIWYRYK